MAAQQREQDASDQAFAGASWHTSSYSGSGANCIEHASLPRGTQAVRDSKDRERGVLTFSPLTWQTFVSGVPSAPPTR
ncbi:DUF397 domain-containing protein [Streptomyces axinellae]|uniref:DUF397 domain-containing protein n=1 Tax=Streptomyces axinellae TaxID=552788 RepID=A0ABP6CWU2_9ACTN